MNKMQLTFIFFSSFVLFISPQTPAFSQSQFNFSPCEKWIIKQITRGDVADLIVEFQEERDRILSATFLEKLFTNDFKNLNINYHGVRIANAVVTESIDLENAGIPFDIKLIHCRFGKDVNISNSFFHKSLSFAGSSFAKISFFSAKIAGNFDCSKAVFNDVNFNGVKVEGSAFLEKAVFKEGVDFTRAEISGNFQVREANFCNTEKAANFNTMKAGGIYIEKAVFEGEVDFRSAEITDNFQACETKFNSTGKRVNFNNIKVGGNIFFEKAVFEGQVDFGNANIIGNFQVNEAKFYNSEKSINFNSMRVGGTAFFKEAVFEGGAEFANADIGGNFQAQKSQFKNPKRVASFNGMKVGAHAFFQEAVFEGLADFTIAEIKGGFNAVETQFKNSEMATNFNGMKVGYKALFEKTVFLGWVSMEYSNFLILVLSDVDWPIASLDGMGYQQISAGDEKGAWKNLLRLVGKSVYNVSVYTKLESFFRQQGYTQRADLVYFNQKFRELFQLIHGSWLSWLFGVTTNILLCVLVGYGCYPSLVLVWGAILLIIGYKIYNKDGMEIKMPEYKSLIYHRLWYSLDLFIPFIDLYAANVWMPKQNRKFALFYMRFLRLSGWVLIPLALAGWTGIIK